MTRVPAQVPVPALAGSQGAVTELTGAAGPPRRWWSTVRRNHTGRCRAGRAARATRVAGVPLVLALLGLAAAPSVIPIRHGDTLWDLAHRYNTTVAALRQLNDLPGDTIYAGQTLLVPTDDGGRTTPTITHQVRPGDTVGAIADRYDVPMSALADRNGLAGEMRIYPGQQLQIPRSPGGSENSPAEPDTSRPTTSDTETDSAGPGGVSGPDGTWHYPPRVTASAAQHQAVLSDRPVPSKEHLRGLIRQTARELGVEEALALAIAEQESGFRMNVVSAADAIGAMQVLPSTGRWLSNDVVGRDLDLLDTEDNVLAGVALLRLLTRSAPMDQAVAGYYQGLESVRTKGMYQDTKRYVANVLALRARWL